MKPLSQSCNAIFERKVILKGDLTFFAGRRNRTLNLPTQLVRCWVVPAILTAFGISPTKSLSPGLVATASGGQTFGSNWLEANGSSELP